MANRIPKSLNCLSREIRYDPLRRRCRTSILRTIGTVRRACLSWYHATGRYFHPDFSPECVKDCSSLSKSVKLFLSESSFCSSEEDRMAFQSIKKLLPDSCKCMEKGMLDDLLVKFFCGAKHRLPDGYLSFVKKEAMRIFPKGWDSGIYTDHAYTTSPPLSSTAEATRKQGGGMSCRFDQVDFLESVIGDEGGDLDDVDDSAIMMVVQSAGKPRPLTKFSEDQLLIKPLHKAMYDCISRQKWLQRGDVSAESLDRAGFSAGRGSLTSGDYKSATDNLSIEVAEKILEGALEHAIDVPVHVKDLALRWLRPRLFRNSDDWLENVIGLSDRSFRPAMGQMMGSLLSFPLLCMQNYLAFEWCSESLRKNTSCSRKNWRVPVLINGDDILFQSDIGFSAAWMSMVSDLGLTVEGTKTSVSDTYGSLNSTLIRYSGDKLRVVPTLRFGMLREPRYPNSLGLGLRSFIRGLKGPAALSAAVQFLCWHKNTIKSTRLSLPELGFSGRLARKAAERVGLFKIGLARTRERKHARLPPVPVPHNVLLGSEEVVRVDKGIGDGLARENARETASWKWSRRGTWDWKSQSVRYWLRVSMLNETKFDLSVFNWSRLSDVEDVERRARMDFGRPRFSEKSVPVFKSVLKMYTDIEEYETLPPYVDPPVRAVVDYCSVESLKTPLVGEGAIRTGDPDVVWGV